MKLDGALPGGPNAILKAHFAEGNDIGVVVIDAGERAVFGEVVIRRIPHLRNRIVCIADAAVNLVPVRFPEALVRLPAELAGGIVLALLDGSREIRREVV